nr:MAG TPA: hypothetical protein [Bacteriophage sp.]
MWYHRHRSMIPHLRYIPFRYTFYRTSILYQQNHD